MSESPLRWQDDILQVMYWMRGEALGTEISVDQLERFVKIERSQLETTLQKLVEINWLRFLGSVDRQVFELTERGIEEGRRRFLEEFSPYLGKETHLSCSDPLCDCHSVEWAGVCRSTGVQ